MKSKKKYKCFELIVIKKCKNMRKIMRIVLFCSVLILVKQGLYP
jgi:hypothetical protein